MLYRQVVATGVACAATFCFLCIFDERHRMGNVSQTNLIMKKMKRRKKRRNWRRRKKKRLKKSRRNSRKRRKKSRRRRRKKSRRKSRKRKKKREQEQEQEEEELEAGTTHKKRAHFFFFFGLILPWVHRYAHFCRQQEQTCGQQQSSYTLDSTAARMNWKRQQHSSCILDPQCSGDREEKED